MTALIPASLADSIALGILGIVIGLRPAAVPPRECHPSRVGVEDPRGAPASCFLPVSRSVSSAGSSPAGSWRS